jgi:hypothetical protein
VFENDVLKIFCNCVNAPIEVIRSEAKIQPLLHMLAFLVSKCTVIIQLKKFFFFLDPVPDACGEIEDKEILGLMCIIDHTDPQFNVVEIELLESSDDQIGGIKKLDRIA